MVYVCLAFLSLLAQTLHSRLNPPTILEPLAFCTPAPLFILYSAHSITEPSLTCKKQHQAQCKKVCICGQEVRHVQRESSLERLRDVVPNQAVKGGAPGPGHTGGACSSRGRNVHRQT